MSQTISNHKAERITSRLDAGLPVSDKARGQLQRFRTRGSKRSVRTHEPYDQGTTDNTVRHLLDSEAATVSYIHTLLDPEAGADTGVSILPGGYAPNSSVVSLRMAGGFAANAAGDAAFGMYAPATNFDPGTPPTGIYAKVPGSAAVGIGYASSATAPSNLPTVGAAALPAGWTQINAPATGLDLLSAEVRLVSMSIRVFPSGPLTTAQGTGMIVRIGVPFEASSASNIPYASIYEQRRNEVHQAPLSGWDPEDCFRVTYLPYRQEQLWFVDAPEAIGNNVGFSWGVFMATGCAASQPFRYEVYANYEIMLNTLTLGRNRLVSDKGMELIAHARPAAPPKVYSESRPSDVTDAPPEGHPEIAPQVASVTSGVYGPKKAFKIFKSIASGAASVGNFLANGFKSIAPALIKAAPAALGLLAMGKKAANRPLLLKMR